MCVTYHSLERSRLSEEVSTAYFSKILLVCEKYVHNIADSFSQKVNAHLRTVLCDSSKSHSFLMLFIRRLDLIDQTVHLSVYFTLELGPKTVHKLRVDFLSQQEWMVRLC